jgi:DNA-binding Lrp family transcriptional regulator
MIEDFKPAPTLMVKDLETLKILADPLRNQILEILAPEKQTVNQIAEKLGLAPSKLYYHINLLEKYGLIQEVDSIVKANIIEKVYWITAYDCKMDENLCNFSTPIGQQTVITTMLAPIDATREDIRRSLEARASALEQGAVEHPRQVVIYREVRSMSDKTADEFAMRLKEVLEDFDEIEDDESGEETHNRALTLAFYPSFYYESQERDESQE